MCGVVGILANSDEDVVPMLLFGLESLEYRGYDSAGIAVIDQQTIHRRRASGKLIHLHQAIQEDPIKSSLGIGHTRWATHGLANKENAHPHVTDHVAIVHNGIIENYHDLRQHLIQKGVLLTSDTDTEVVAHIIDSYLDKGFSPLEAVAQTQNRVEGSYALAIIFKDYPDLLIAARHRSPLVLGFSDTAIYVGSDTLALSAWTNRVCYLEDGDIAVLKRVPNNYSQIDEGLDSPSPSISFSFTHDIFNNQQDVTKKRLITTVPPNNIRSSKGVYPHYMIKEMMEQPSVLTDTLLSSWDPLMQKWCFDAKIQDRLAKVKRIKVVACGTSFYTGLLATYWIEDLVGVSCTCEIASEFRYRNPVINDVDLVILISQSGETIDTLAALDLCKAQGVPTLAIVNVAESSIARLSDYMIQTLAGPEIGVASTKAFTTQLLILLMIAGLMAHQRAMPPFLEYSELTKLPGYVTQMLSLQDSIRAIAQEMVSLRNILYVGRGVNYVVALEGALKLKELSYINAQAYPAGELKHGPIALIDPSVHVVAIAPQDRWFDKTMSNLHEILARGGHILLMSDVVADPLTADPKNQQKVKKILIPRMQAIFNPILYTIPVQLLAYHIATLKGCDVDQPRNLAKSVTVE